MAMIDPNGIMPLNFFKYKGVYTGQHNGMRYMLKQTGEKPDLKLSACVWRGPYAVSYTHLTLPTTSRV